MHVFKVYIAGLWGVSLRKAQHNLTKANRIIMEGVPRHQRFTAGPSLLVLCFYNLSFI